MNMQFKTIKDYKIIEELSSPNSQNKFYLAKDENLNRFVGIKTFSLQNIKYSQVLDEVRANLNIKKYSPFIPDIYDVINKDNTIYIFFEYIGKNNLRSLMNKDGLPLKEAVNILLKIVDILETVEKNFKGVNHRDLKPENILVDNQKNIYLIDYGLTIIPPTFNEGTKNYCAPEQSNTGNIKIELASSGRVDQFSLGVIFAELLLGFTPIKGIHYTFKISEDQRKWPLVEELKKKQVNNGAIFMILKLMSIEANKRYFNMNEVKINLKRLSGNNGNDKKYNNR